MKKILLILLAIPMLASCMSGKLTIDKQANMSSYQGFTDEEHVFLETDLSKANKLITSSDQAIVYFGFSSCPWCIELLPVLNEQVKSAGLQVNYVNVRPNGSDDLRTIENRDYVTLLKNLDEFLMVDENGAKRMGVPFVAFIKDGKIVDTHVGTLPDHDAKERKMTVAEVLELNQIIQQKINKIK